jgi:uncharacterized protein YeaO (DUF488 family)
MVRIRRVYEGPVADGSRSMLIDRLWPRGVPKTALRHDAWLKDVAPSPELRRWFDHDPAKWAEFRGRYRQELQGNRDALTPPLDAAAAGDVTLLFAARDADHNHAIVLKEYLEEMLARRGANGR